MKSRSSTLSLSLSRNNTLVLNRIKECYLLWRKFFHKFPKPFRHTLAEKIDSLFISLIDTLYTAQYEKGDSKVKILREAVTLIDSLKLFIQIAWEAKELEEKKFISLSEMLIESSKMLSGWYNYLLNKNSRS